MPTYEYNRDYPFATLITNLGKYNEGELIGEWVKFPTTAEEIKRLTKYAVRYEDEFLKPVMGSTQKTAESECKRKQKNFPPQEPETMNWTAFLSGSMRIIFPANCLMDAFPECPSATRRNNWNSRSA